MFIIPQTYVCRFTIFCPCRTIAIACVHQCLDVFVARLLYSVYHYLDIHVACVWHFCAQYIIGYMLYLCTLPPPICCAYSVLCALYTIVSLFSKCVCYLYTVFLALNVLTICCIPCSEQSVQLYFQLVAYVAWMCYCLQAVFCALCAIVLRSFSLLIPSRCIFCCIPAWGHHCLDACIAQALCFCFCHRYMDYCILYQALGLAILYSVFSGSYTIVCALCVLTMLYILQSVPSTFP